MRRGASSRSRRTCNDTQRRMQLQATTRRAARRHTRARGDVHASHTPRAVRPADCARMSILEMLRPPSGLRVLVTAGAGGTGAAVARAFVQAGARVHVCDIDRSALDRLARDTPGIAGSMADVSDRADVERVFDDL